MQNNILKARRALAEKMIPKMELRQYQAFYVDSKEEAFQKVLECLKEGDTIAHGGSESMKEIGIMSYLQGEGGKKYNFLDRSLAKTAEENREYFAKAILADAFLMSTNAITMDGELVNVDGRGNRVAALCYGPDRVIIVAGMNKVCKDIESAIWRVCNIAAPPNAIRLSCDTPCTQIGRCGDCFKDDCICAHTVITRLSKTPGRIKVILVGEDLGY